MRITEVIGERVRAQREKRGWTQAELGKRIGARLGQEWTRQQISAAEKGKRAFTAAELVVFAKVLDVSFSYLLMPPPEINVIELAPGVDADLSDILEAASPFKGVDSTEAKFAEVGLRFFQHLAELAELMKQTQADMEEFVTNLQAVHAEREEKKK